MAARARAGNQSVTETFQHANHAQAAHRGARLQRQALAGERIYDGQDAQVPSAGQRIGHEIERPFFIRGACGNHGHALAHQPFALLPPQAESSFAIDSLHAFVIAPRLAAQQHVQSRRAIARILVRQLNQPRAQHALLFSRP